MIYPLKRRYIYSFLSGLSYYRTKAFSIFSKANVILTKDISDIILSLTNFYILHLYKYTYAFDELTTSPKHMHNPSQDNFMYRNLSYTSYN